MPEINYVTHTRVRTLAPLRRMSWGAIFAGACCGLAIAVTLDLLGLGVLGVTASPGGITHPLTLGAGIWLGAASLISFFIGGWVSGRMAGVPLRSSGAVHGLTVWALAVVAVGLVVGGLAYGTLQTAVTANTNVAAASSANPNAPALTANQQIQQQVRQMANTASPRAATDASVAGFGLFIGLALTCIFAMLGGAAGAPQPAETAVAVRESVAEPPVVRREEPPRRVA